MFVCRDGEGKPGLKRKDQETESRVHFRSFWTDESLKVGAKSESNAKGGVRVKSETTTTKNVWSLVWVPDLSTEDMFRANFFVLFF